MLAARIEQDRRRAEAERAAPGAVDPAIDLVHLARQTDGDGALEAELLAMFDAQAAKLIQRLLQAEVGARAKADIAHRLRGSALAIGAARVTAAAEAVERHFERVAQGTSTGEAPLAALVSAINEARLEIQRLDA